MRICCISDLHGQFPEIPPCDLLLIAGDICPTSNHDGMFQLEWLKTTWREWMDSIPVKYKVMTPGNHDFVFQEMSPERIGDIGCTVLIDKTIEIEGLKIHGSPWQLWFYDWAFNAPKEGGEKFLHEKYEQIPPDCDIIITHGPPYQVGDKIKGGPHTGSEALYCRIVVNEPKLVVTGHIHEGYGTYDIFKTKVVNAAVLDENYKLVNKPIIIE
jgi:Icc-related predicted phosphoesterase